jgi:hypothetical protein
MSAAKRECPRRYSKGGCVVVSECGLARGVVVRMTASRRADAPLGANLVRGVSKFFRNGWLRVVSMAREMVVSAYCGEENHAEGRCSEMAAFLFSMARGMVVSDDCGEGEVPKGKRPEVAALLFCCFMARGWACPMNVASEKPKGDVHASPGAALPHARIWAEVELLCPSSRRSGRCDAEIELRAVGRRRDVHVLCNSETTKNVSREFKTVTCTVTGRERSYAPPRRQRQSTSQES